MLYYTLLATLLISTVVAGFNTPVGGVPYDGTYSAAAHAMMAISYLALLLRRRLEYTLTRYTERRTALLSRQAQITKAASGKGAVFCCG